MSDLISRKAAIDALVSMTIYTKEELKEYREESAYKDCWTNGIYDAVEKIEQLPPIQSKLLQPWEVLVAQAVLPQPEIVRCEECLYRKICSWEKQGAKFCSFAERREVTT